MASPAIADAGRRVLTSLAVIATTLLAWAALVPMMSSVAARLCSADTGPVGLVAVWTLMGATMMLPVALPLVVRKSGRDLAVFLAGYIAITIVPSLGAGGLETLLRANGAMSGNAPVFDAQVALTVLAIAALLWPRVRLAETCGSGIRAGISHFGMCTATAALQLGFGGMRPEAMMVLTLWMLAVTISPFGRGLSGAQACGIKQTISLTSTDPSAPA